MPSNARCGHFEYDKGHCGQFDCPNFIQACPECRTPTVREQAREAVRGMWNAAFGCDPQ